MTNFDIIMIIVCAAIATAFGVVGVIHAMTWEEPYEEFPTWIDEPEYYLLLDGEILSFYSRQTAELAFHAATTFKSKSLFHKDCLLFSYPEKSTPHSPSQPQQPSPPM